MPLPIIAVDIAPGPETTAVETRALLRACSEAATPAECVMAAEAPAVRSPIAVAIVSWSSPTASRVEVGVRRHRTTLWSERELQFRPDDPVSERWRSIGFMVGTIARNGAPALTPVTAPLPNRVVVHVPRPEAPPDWRGWLDLGVALEPSYPSGPWMTGAELRFALAGSDWPLLMLAGVRYATQLYLDEGFSLQGPLCSLGTAYTLAPPRLPLSLLFHAGGAAQRLRMSLEVADGRRASAAYWRAGGYLGSELEIAVSSGVAASLGVEGILLHRGFDVTASALGEESRSIPSASWRFHAGLRWHPWR